MLSRMLLVAVAAVLPFAAMAQRERSHDDPLGRELNYFKRAQPDRVALLTAAGEGIEVRRIVIQLRDELLGVETSDGVESRNEDRVRLRSLPVLGWLFFDRFRQDDIAARNRVGAVYRDGDSLFVRIDPEQPKHPITRVAILNQDNAYFLAGAPRPVRFKGPPSPGARVGNAFVKDGETLLLLVEPSVIQHSIF